MYLFQWTFCPEICPGVELLDHMVVLYLVFWDSSIHSCTFFWEDFNCVGHLYHAPFIFLYIKCSIQGLAYSRYTINAYWMSKWMDRTRIFFVFLLCVSLSLLFFFFFFSSPHHSMWTFLGQGSNLYHSYKSSHSTDNTRSLTHSATRELPFVVSSL